MYEKEKEEILKTALKLDRYGLIALSGGNITVRLENGHILMTPSGMIYDEMVPSDILVFDLDGNIVEGTRKQSSDTSALLYILKYKPEVNAIIHTHQPYATAAGLIADELPCNLTTLANATKGSVNVAPYVSAACEQMGVEVVKYLGDKLAVILKHHGVVSVGKSLREALFSCVYLEEAAKTYAIAYMMDKNMPMFNQEQIDTAVEVFNHYGQDKK